jgi:hypothetical protein
MVDVHDCCHSTHTSSLLCCRAVGIVQQNQIKKARKIQDDIRAEHDRLVSSHVSRLRRAAAAELQADTAAKQVTMSWLQGGLTEEELEHLDHWRSVLATVLDLQERQQAGGQPPPQQPHRKHKAAAAAGASAEGQTAAAGAPGHVPEKLLAWLQSPESSRHYLCVMLECLRELGATDVPARVLMQHKVRQACALYVWIRLFPAAGALSRDRYVQYGGFSFFECCMLVSGRWLTACRVHMCGVLTVLCCVWLPLLSCS